MYRYMVRYSPYAAYCGAAWCFFVVWGVFCYRECRRFSVLNLCVFVCAHEVFLVFYRVDGGCMFDVVLL